MDMEHCWWCGKRKIPNTDLSSTEFTPRPPFGLPFCSVRCEKDADDYLTFLWYDRAIRDRGSGALINGKEEDLRPTNVS